MHTDSGHPMDFVRRPNLGRCMEKCSRNREQPRREPVPGTGPAGDKSCQPAMGHRPNPVHRRKQNHRELREHGKAGAGWARSVSAGTLRRHTARPETRAVKLGSRLDSACRFHGHVPAHTSGGSPAFPAGSTHPARRHEVTMARGISAIGEHVHACRRSAARTLDS